MRIVAVSDTHLTHEHWRLEIPDGDLLIHAGDATLRGTEDEVIAFNRWFSNLPHSLKIFVAGNHDRLFETDPERARELLHPSIYYLRDSEILVAGLRIYGSPWQPAFNLATREELEKKWGLIPPGLDILVTHCPPYGMGDTLPGSGHIGCADLARAVRKIRPKYHIFGHVHHGHGVYTKRNHRTTYINAAIVDEEYYPAHDPTVIEV